VTLPLFKEANFELHSGGTEMIDFREQKNRIIAGDALHVLDKMPVNSVDCIVTSPPYFGQRDYSHEYQVGKEASPEGYIDTLVKIFNKARNVLKPTGTFW
jgi:site-specific DNA-methyltransferase (adenine-specific)